ncbi:MAG: DNA adenine methylase, partial [Planctomycetota bacterium]
MSATAKLKAPFPYFGGKSAVADLVWDRLGNPDNYVEPFAGTAATLLRRPSPGKVETINDANHFVVNFWRAVKHDRAGVIEHADWAVSEADLHARHNWLLNNCNSAEFVNQMAADPEFYCAKSAGWWVWGQCCWIGSGWCD